MEKPDEISAEIISYINEIGERLWSGHATLMVGAGFSKNARPIGNITKKLPDWKDLGDLFYEKLYGDAPGNKKYLSVLKLAGEYQAAFGRPSLDQLLRESTPDNAYEPSELHKKLLGLPWTDIFTTNYDTLLERAADSALFFKYDVIINPQDLTYSEKPRIIKLHGSFPSQRPFIITDEDYRQYPKKFAPFVNTVQQSLMENTLCMIGFSGDDPNFLQWIGWIRDNLGNMASPKIYLIGIFNLSDAQIKLLEQRHICLVDLTKFPNVNGNHYEAFSCFHKYLLFTKKGDDYLNWPQNQEMRHYRDDESDNIEKITKVVAEWQKIRDSYPGWCIVPEDRRDALWTFTRNWVWFPLKQKEWKGTLDIEFAYELNWRLEKCLLPIPNEVFGFFETVLDKYDPYKPDSPQEPGDPSAETKNRFKSRWLELKLAMFRFYREEGLLEKWEKTNNEFDLLCQDLSPSEVARWHYERVMAALFAVDVPAAKDRLSLWPPNESLPFWEAKRAALLAEVLGQVDEARQTLETSLKNIRLNLNLRPVRTDVSWVSQEACIMVLARYFQRIKDCMSKEYSDMKDQEQEFQKRWNVLKQYKCDPLGELGLFEARLEGKPDIKSDVTEKTSFDIGRVSRTYHMGEDHEAITGYTFLRFCEEIGTPFRISNFTSKTKEAQGAIDRICRYSSYWATATLFRIGEKKVISSIFNRESLHNRNTAFVDNLVDKYIKAFQQNVSECQNSDDLELLGYGNLIVEIIPEILSRLCCKSSPASQARLLDFVLDIYKSGHMIRYADTHNLIRRLFETLTIRQQYEAIPRLLLPCHKNHNLIDDRISIHPFNFLNLLKSDIEDANLQPLDLDEKSIAVLLEEAKSENKHKRKWATFTLLNLYVLGLLGTDMDAKLAEILWSQTDSYGFPDKTIYYKFAFFNFPQPDNIDLAVLFKHYVFSTPFPKQDKNEKKVHFYEGDIPICKNIIGGSKHIKWNTEECNKILNELLDWWNADKDNLIKYKEQEKTRVNFLGLSPCKEFKSRFELLIEVFAVAVAPACDSSTDEKTKNNLEYLLDDLGKYGLPSIYAQASCLHIFPDKSEQILTRICEALESDQPDMIRDAHWAMFECLEKHQTMFDLAEMCNPLAQIIRWRPKSNLRLALRPLANLIDKKLFCFENNIEQMILKGLQHIAADTNLDEKANDWTFDEKLALRKGAANLAYEISRHYTKEGTEFPEAIKKWQDICDSEDEFAEIRNQWRNYCDRSMMLQYPY